MGTLTSEVIFQLTGFGSKTDEFIQLQKGQTLAQGQVDEGFCAGVCTDWARRVLGGGRAAFTQKATRVKSQTNRQATIQLRFQGMSETRKAIVAVRNELVAVYNDHLADQSFQISPQLQTKVQNYLTITVTPDRRYATSAVGQWLDLLEEMQDESDRTRPAGWAALVQGMDQRQKEKRQEDARGESHRKFSSIKIVQTAKLSGANVKGNIDSMLSVPEFVAGTVLFMGFDLFVDNKATGHAVAAFLANNGTYQFLDPNFGIYAYDEGGLRSALYYLFSNHYHDDAIYGEDGAAVTGTTNYILFKHV